MCKPVVHHQVEGTLGVKRIEHLLSMPWEWTETVGGSDEALRPVQGQGGCQSRASKETGENGTQGQTQ